MMYHNLGLEIKYPDPKKDNKHSLFDKSDKELYKLRDDMRKTYGAV